MKKLFAISVVALFCLSAFAQKQEVRFFSHRGGRMEYDENTLSAFESSYEKGYRGYETDVRMTKDGQLVILHDADLKRTTNMEGRVEEMTAAQIRKAETKAGHKVLFLDELMKWIDSKGDITYIEFELKSKPVELYPTERLHEYVDKLYAKVMKNKPEGAIYLFTSSDYRGLRYLQEKYNAENLLLITGDPVCDETINLCRKLGITRLGATMDGTSRKAVKKAHEKGLIISLWPGSNTDDAVLGVWLGADYLCTDVPVAVKEYMEKNFPDVKAVY